MLQTHLPYLHGCLVWTLNHMKFVFWHEATVWTCCWQLEMPPCHVFLVAEVPWGPFWSPSMFCTWNLLVGYCKGIPINQPPSKLWVTPDAIVANNKWLWVCWCVLTTIPGVVWPLGAIGGNIPSGFPGSCSLVVHSNSQCLQDSCALLTWLASCHPDVPSHGATPSHMGTNVSIPDMPRSSLHEVPWDLSDVLLGPLLRLISHCKSNGILVWMILGSNRI